MTPANTADVTAVPDLLYGEEDRVGGDSGYLGADKRKDAVKKNKAGKKIKYNITEKTLPKRAILCKEKGT